MSITVRSATVFKTWVDCWDLSVGTSAESTGTIGHGSTYGRMAERRERRTTVGGMFKVTVGREMQAMLRVCPKVDLHGFGNSYNLR
jgi:hypothetical protein